MYNNLNNKRLAIVTTHPVQYNAPLFKLLATHENITVKVFYTWGQSRESVFDEGFKIQRKWDVPLLEGYEYEFVKNISWKPGSHHFLGTVNPKLIQILKQWKPDAILVYGWSFYSHLKILLHFKGKVKLFFRGDSTLLDESKGWSFKKLLRRTLLKWIYKHIDIALYVGSNNKQYYLKHGLPEKKLVLAPHVVDNVRFGDISGKYETAATEWKKILGIRNYGITFLFAGKLEQKKNVNLLIDIFIKLSTINTYLIIVGNGILEKDLKIFASECKQIIFLDFQNQSMMPVVYRLGDVFVLPSQGPNETWGLAINEAMACSRPVIASDKCGGAIDLISSRYNGNIFNSNDRQELYSLMSDVIANKEKYKRMRMAAAESIKQYNYTTVADTIAKYL